MLINFQVTNFRSFKDTNYFSMEKGKNIRKYKNNVLEIGKTKLLKTSVLFGGNANGKTNLLTALIFLRFLVIHPVHDNTKKLPTDTFGSNQRNTKFVIAFLKNEQRFDYELEYTEDQIENEVLKVNGKVFFERHSQNFVILPEQLKPIQQNILKNKNLLFFAQDNNVEKAKIAYNWFKEDLIMVNTEQISNSLFKLFKDPKFKNKVLKFLRAADFNITDIDVKERKETFQQLQIDLNERVVVPQANNNSVEKTIYDVYCIHQAENETFQIHFNNESAGTKVFMFLALYILRTENSGKVLLIDEFDRSFHLELAKALLDLFTNEHQKNQFILTTHELSLMDYNLRQDQIWFAEKNEYGETELFSIYDFDNVALSRSDFGYKKRYLEGRFGASQIINKSVLLEIVENSDDQTEKR